jgi:hypothetical protein
LVMTLIGSGAILLRGRSFTMVMVINLPPISALPSRVDLLAPCGERSEPAGPLSGSMRTRKDINQTIPGGQHLDPVQTLINANVSSCQEDFYHLFYCECFSKSSKKFDLNLLRVKPFEWKEKIAEMQGIAA